MPSRPRAFLDIGIGGEPAGRLVIELFRDKTPRTCDNFLALCTSFEKPSLNYKNTPFHRIIDEFMVQGGDITRGDGTGGTSIYGDEFADENLGWRDVDEAGLLCMANRGKDTNSSQFFITLAPCPHLNLKHTIFGRLVSGKDDVLASMAAVPTDKDDKPRIPVVVTHSGELERRAKRVEAITRTEDLRSGQEESTDDHRSRPKRRRKGSATASDDDEDEDDAEKQRKHRRRRHRHHSPLTRSDAAASEEELDEREAMRKLHHHRHRHHRRSEASPDATMRGRSRRSRSKSANGETKHGTGEKKTRKADRDDERHHRSPEPSRHIIQERADQSADGPGYGRRQRSMPNQYHVHGQGTKSGERWRSKDIRLRDEEDEARMRWEEWEREGGDSRYCDVRDDEGRLGGAIVSGGKDQGGDGVKFKGRGAMKYREKRW